MRKVAYEDSLEAKYPEIAAQWHPTKNNDLKPSEITFGSGKKVWWHCPNCKYDWITGIHYRTRKQNPTGCPECGKLRTKLKSSKTNQKFIEDAINIHGYDYDYSKIMYVGSHIKVIIVCKEHGEFQQFPYDHLKGRGCSKCGNKKTSLCLKKSTQVFIEESIIVHGNKYDYSLSDYRSNNIPIVIVCKDHGEFKQIPINHLRGQGCARCSESKGEKVIREYLQKSNIEYKSQKTFNSCRSKNKLKFDFCVYIDRKAFLIEYNGQQHYEPAHHWHKENASMLLNETQVRDKIKSDWAAANNIPLLVIPYWEFNNIEKLLGEFLGLAPTIC